jgi:Protein of unknown function (DUF1156)
MIPKECKRLAEVDFPIAVVSKHSAREKSIRHGHPSTLHLWWARRPLAACRAMLLGLLLPDPADANCPGSFKTKARALLPKVVGNVGPQDLELRQALLKFIGDFASWDAASNHTFLEVGRGLVKAANGEEAPLVGDPFAGGGSIPLEALRLGCETFASDLNPVACLILKVMLEDIPRHGSRLAEELRHVGAEIKKAAEKELAEFYPLDRTVQGPLRISGRGRFVVSRRTAALSSHSSDPSGFVRNLPGDVHCGTPLKSPKGNLPSSSSRSLNLDRMGMSSRELSHGPMLPVPVATSFCQPHEFAASWQSSGVGQT